MGKQPVVRYLTKAITLIEALAIVWTLYRPFGRAPIVPGPEGRSAHMRSRPTGWKPPSRGRKSTPNRDRPPRQTLTTPARPASEGSVASTQAATHASKPPTRSVALTPAGSVGVRAPYSARGHGQPRAWGPLPPGCPAQADQAPTQVRCLQRQVAPIRSTRPACTCSAHGGRLPRPGRSAKHPRPGHGPVRPLGGARKDRYCG